MQSSAVTKYVARAIRMAKRAHFQGWFVDRQMTFYGWPIAGERKRPSEAAHEVTLLPCRSEGASDRAIGSNSKTPVFKGVPIQTGRLSKEAGQQDPNRTMCRSAPSRPRRQAGRLVRPQRAQRQGRQKNKRSGDWTIHQALLIGYHNLVQLLDIRRGRGQPA